MMWILMWLIAERDSRKDEAVVFVFIFATAGLLIWAAVKPWVGKWMEVSGPDQGHQLHGRADKLLEQSARERSSYIPLPNQADN